MSIARITGGGLIAIAICVAALWACAVADRLMIARVRQERAQVLQDLRSLRRNLQQPRPASVPMPAPFRRSRPTAS